MPGDPKRRDIVVALAGAFTAVGAAAAVYVLARGSSGPRSTTSAVTTPVDLAGIPEGQTRVVNVLGLPVYVRHRPFGEVERARAEDGKHWRDPAARNDLRDPKAPATDTNRSIDGRPAWLVVVGRCTKDDCLLQSIDGPDRLAEGVGWFCPCCASRYDLSGRVLTGPAPQNLRVPRHTLSGQSLKL